MKKFRYILITYTFLLSIGAVNAQEREWEIDKIQRKEQEKKQSLDSILVHLKNKWEIKFAYGKLYFDKGARSINKEQFFLSNPMNLWQLSSSWHFSERLFADISIGFQLQKNIPVPDIFSILNGNRIELEGSGVLFLPMDLGLKYYLTQKRFRPLVGVSIGSVLANSKYTIAEGNISTGIIRRDFQVRERALFGKINTGFDYRSGKHTNLSLNFSYFLLGNFKEPIGGYLNYEGFVVNVGFSFLL